MANSKSYGVLAVFIVAGLLFVTFLAAEVHGKIKAHKHEMLCVQQTVALGVPRNQIVTEHGTCRVKEPM